MSELLQVMVAKRGILVYRTATQHPISVVANRVLSFRRTREGERVVIGVGVLLWPRICISIVWRRP